MPNSLPQLNRLFLTDGGLETDFIFNRGFELPCFASIMLLRSEEGRGELESYFRSYLDLACRLGTGCLLESASWRASRDWAPKLGIGQDELDRLNRASVEMLVELRREYESDAVPVVVSGCIGPRGDGYDPGAIMSIDQAETYHSRQAEALALGRPDLLSAITMTNVNEAIGIARAARQASLPAVISFTVETDGRLPTGDSLEGAIEAVDQATGGYPAYYMINCAHPTHFAGILDDSGAWTNRIRGLRANASRCSHAELDSMEELDTGDPVELGQLYRQLRERLPHLNVLGGCCGTDLRHVSAIAEECALHNPEPRGGAARSLIADGSTPSRALPLRIRRRGSFVLPLRPASSFDLFTAEGERRWVDGWEPVILSNCGGTEPGSVFLTDHGGERTIWTVLEADRGAGRLAYSRVSPGRRAGTVHVRLFGDGDGTRVEVAYDITSLGPEGDEAVRSMDDAGFERMLGEWQRLIVGALERTCDTVAVPAD